MGSFAFSLIPGRDASRIYEMWLAAFVITIVALVAAVSWGLYLRVDRSRLADERERSDRLVNSLREKNHELDKQLTQTRTQLGGIDEKFKSLASEALKQSNEQFLQLARKTFDVEQKQATSELEKRKQAIDMLLKPLREVLEQQQRSVQEAEQKRRQAYGSLSQQLTSMLEDQRLLRRQTSDLTHALRRSDVRGRWGELSLKRIAEMAGMVPHCDFAEQVTIWKGDERLRPDMVVRLPSDRSIVIDAKAPMAAYLEGLEANDPEQRRQCMVKHLAHVDSRVRELSSKNYADHLERSADFVVLFIPGDSFLVPAVELRPDLLEFAMSQGVVIATPTTLVSLLKIIELGWREEKIAENARRISDLGQELHERIATATGHVDRLGANLSKAVQSYNQFVGSFETRVVSTARKFKELGADSGKKLPEEGGLEPIEVVSRQLKRTDA